MKKIFTLLSLLMLSLSTWAVGEVYQITFNNKNVETINGEEVAAGTFFQWNTAKHNFNSKFNGVTWEGIDFTSGLKMEGATDVSFESTAESTVTIVVSTWSSNTIKFDGVELAFADAESATNCYIFTLAGTAAGTHHVTRGSGENGIFAIRVVYTGEAKVKLATPEVTADESNGQVSIGAVANAKEIRYTIDGSEPTAENGEVYSAPFTVEDGVIVKAVAIGEGTYVTSSVAEKQVLLAATVPAAPIVKTQAGAVAISCTTAAVTLQYSTDGTNFKTYKRAFAITKEQTIYARATRGDKVSEVTELAVKPIAQPNDVETIVLNGDDFSFDDVVATGNDGTDVEGITLTIGVAGKTWAKASEIEIPNYGSTAALRSSNGATTTLKLPEGKKAVRLTLYSYINAAATGARVCAWREVNGQDWPADEVPMGAFTSESDYLNTPDVRTYLIDGKNEVTFTNTGEQLCFVAVVDIATDATTIPVITGITNVKAAAENAAAYNLAGQKVGKDYKGVVIVNGKKLIQK